MTLPTALRMGVVSNCQSICDTSEVVPHLRMELIAVSEQEYMKAKWLGLQSTNARS